MAPPLLTALRRSFVRSWHRFLCLLFSPLLLALAGALLYVFMPFPAPADLEADALARLRAGEWVTRVYKADSPLLRQSGVVDPAGLLAQYDRSYFILTFAWSPSAPLDLHFLAPNGSVTTLSVPVASPPRSAFARIPAAVGDGDGVSLPWFKEEDAAILWTRGGSFLPDRRRERDATLLVGTAGIASSPEGHERGEGSVTFSVHTATLGAEAPALVLPLLSLHLGAGDPRAVERVAFSPPQLVRSAEGEMAPAPTVGAPSWTLPVRVAVLDAIIFCVFATRTAVYWGSRAFAAAVALAVFAWVVQVAWRERAEGSVRLGSPVERSGKDAQRFVLPTVVITDSDESESRQEKEKRGF